MSQEPFLQRAWYSFIYCLVKLFFARVQVRGLENVPSKGPIIFVSNHTNGLVDGMILAAYLPRRVRFLAKSTIWNIPILRKLVEISGGIPVYRRQDAAAEMGKNHDVFVHTYGLLATGSALAIFPEGISHNEPSLQSLKTGVARIVLGAEHYFPELDVPVIPVGLSFTNRSQSRSDVFVEIGEPIETANLTETMDFESREAVGTLMEKIQTGIEEVTINYPSWDEASLIEGAARIYAYDQTPSPKRPGLAKEFLWKKRFAQAYAQLKEHHPQAIEKAVSVMEQYHELQHTFALCHFSAMETHPRWLAWGLLLRCGYLLGIQLPLAILGMLLNLVPYEISRAVAIMNEEEDLRATIKILSALVLFPLVWSIQALCVAAAFGSIPALLFLLISPFAAGYALSVWRNPKQLWSEVRSYWYLKTYHGMRQELQQRQHEVLEQITLLEKLSMKETLPE